MTVWSLQDQLAEAIEMLLDRHPMGMRVLMGEAPPPSTEDIHLMYAAERLPDDLGVRVDGGEHVTRAEQIVFDAERFERIIERAGGWEHIARTSREWEATNPKSWKIVEEHVKWMTYGAFSRLDDARLQTIALRLGVSPETVQRYRREFPLDLARVILLARPILNLMP